MALIDLKKYRANMLMKLASFRNWQGRQFAIQVAGKGFSYTGRDAVVMCDTCNATVDLKVKDVVSLDDEHDRCCRIKEYLKRMTGNPNEVESANQSNEGHTYSLTDHWQTVNPANERQTSYPTNERETVSQSLNREDTADPTTEIETANQENEAETVISFNEKDKASPAYEGEIVHPVIKKNTANQTYKGETVHAFKKDDTASTSNESETAYSPKQGQTANSTIDGRTTDPTCEEKTTSPTNDERRTANSTIEGQTAKPTYEQETANHIYKGETANHTYKGETANHTYKGETTNHTYKGQTDNHTYKGETANTTIERQTAYSTIERRTADPTYEGETASHPNFPNIGHTTPILSGYWKDDLAIYPHLASIINAPSVCPCLICYHSTDIIRIEEETDMNICKKISGNSLVLILKRQLEYNNNLPLHPEFEALEVRKSSFRNTNVDSNDVDCQTKSGFYCLGNGSRECFYCGICLCEEYLKFDPFKEHARWSPFCPHVLQLRGKEFIHDVIADTRMLKNYLKGQDRPARMELNVVEEAMKYYPQYIVSEAINALFIEYGSFPNREELFDVLESRRLWKTCESYDYCRY